MIWRWFTNGMRPPRPGRAPSVEAALAAGSDGERLAALAELVAERDASLSAAAAAAVRDLVAEYGPGALPRLDASVRGWHAWVGGFWHRNPDAVRRLTLAPADAEPAVLEELFAAHALPHVRRNALLLLARRGKWSGIVHLLRALRDGDVSVAEMARADLTRWRRTFNRTFVQPSPEERERVRAAVDASAGELDASTLEWLRFAAS
jgi:hypothetical protein